MSNAAYLVVALALVLSILQTAPAQTISCGLFRGHRLRASEGQPARNGELPWLASIYNDDVYSCGGVIVGERHVLTAASCIVPVGESPENTHEIPLEISVGDRIVKKHRLEQRLKVDKVSIHPRYRHMFNHEFDIAVLRTEEPIEFSLSGQDAVNSICLPKSNIGYEDSSYVWMARREKEKGDEHWTVGKLDVDTAECDHGLVCLEEMGNFSVCPSDIGLPTFRYDPSGQGRAELVSIITWAPRCHGRKINPWDTIHSTQVSLHVDWINQMIGSRESRTRYAGLSS